MRPLPEAVSALLDQMTPLRRVPGSWWACVNVLRDIYGKEPVDAEVNRQLLELMGAKEAPMRERTVTQSVRDLLKLACVTDTAQVEYIMDGLVPIFQQARDEAVADHPDERWQRHVDYPTCATCNGARRLCIDGVSEVCPSCAGSGKAR